MAHEAPGAICISHFLRAPSMNQRRSVTLGSGGNSSSSPVHGPEKPPFVVESLPIGRRSLTTGPRSVSFPAVELITTVAPATKFAEQKKMISQTYFVMTPALHVVRKRGAVDLLLEGDGTAATVAYVLHNLSCFFRIFLCRFQQKNLLECDRRERLLVPAFFP